MFVFFVLAYFIYYAVGYVVALFHCMPLPVVVSLSDGVQFG